MAELTDMQRQMLALALSSAGPALIPGASPILGPSMSPRPSAGLPPAVLQAIEPNIGINFGKKGDFVTGVNPPFTNNSDPTMPSIRLPAGDQSFERQAQPWWNGDRTLRRT